MNEATDSRWFREVLGQYPTGVCVVTATQPDGSKAGFVVGSFTSVSLDPPLVAFFPDKQSTSWPKIERAGRFCVNILSAEQEHICRRFAAKAEDKFQGLETTTAKSGSPIIGGAVAWIDCELESVHEAGDHYVVMGRVQELDIQNASLPLLFFQGGYGRFAPLSLAAPSRGVLSEQLRQVDLLRPEMELLANDLSSRCVATAVVDDELIVLASAASPKTKSSPTPVGVRLPFAPPYGAAFAAWSGDDRVDRWLELLPDDTARAEQVRRLAMVRTRGCSLGLRSEAQRQFASMVDQLAANPESVDAGSLVTLAGRQNYDPDLSPEAKAAVRIIAVPVFGPDGDVAVALTVYGFPRPGTPVEVDSYIDRVRQAGERATRRLGGRPPEQS